MHRIALSEFDMIKTHPISGTQQAQKWLDQFSMGDRPLAQELLESFLLVSRDDFNDHLRALTLEHADRVKGLLLSMPSVNLDTDLGCLTGFLKSRRESIDVH